MLLEKLMVTGLFIPFSCFKDSKLAKSNINTNTNVMTTPQKCSSSEADFEYNIPLDHGKIH